MATKTGRKRSKKVKTTGAAETGPKTGAPKLNLPLLEIVGIESIQRTCASTRNKREFLRTLPTSEIRQQVWLGLIELVERVLSWPRMTSKGYENAADDLAGIAIAAAGFLEDLADPLSMESLNVTMAAMRKNYWPVLLQLGLKRNRNGGLMVTLEGTGKAKLYLSRIRLGQDAAGTFKFIRADDNPFSRAAELVLAQLLRWREVGAWRGEPTRWAKDLLSLDFPMTIENCERWWRVAKCWLDEQWGTDPEQFKPLISACKSKGKSLAGDRHELWQSEIRSRVIDLRIKDAFFALAERGL